MQLILLNANTTAAMTDGLVQAARRLAGPAVAITGVTARFGAAYIATRSAAAIAGHAALDLLAEHVGRDNPRNYDAALLACFGDPGLSALRELSPIPVLGMAEASLGLAAQLGARIGIITGGARWVAMLREFALLSGRADRVAGIRATALTGAEIAADPAGATGQLRELARRCVDEDGADVIVLGGAGLVGLAGALRPHVDVPLLDSLACLVAAGLSAARLGVAKPASGSFAPPPRIATLGLSPSLAVAL